MARRFGFRQLCPPQFELCTAALVVAQLALKPCVLALALPIPKRGRSVVPARGLLMATRGLPMELRTLGHRSSMREDH